MTNTKQDNNVNNRTRAVYAEIRIELLWLIGQDAIYYEK